jgi:hypothetical protein
MKLIKILQESDVKSHHKKILNFMIKNDVDNDPETIWDFLTYELQIDEFKLKSEIIYLYTNYYGTPIEDLDTINIDFDEILGDYDNKQIALSIFLDVPVMLIKPETHNHYGLHVYRDLVSDYSYAVGDDDEVESALDEYYENYLDQIGGVGNLDRYIVDDFIKIDSYTLSELSREEAQNEIDSLEDEEILERMGYDISEYDEDSILELIEKAKDDLLDKLTEQYEYDIDNEGIDWFMNMGYSYSDAIESFFVLDEEGLINYIREKEENIAVLSTYNGYKNEQFYDNEFYYIYDLG